MRRFYDKSEIWFAVMWIILHVVGVSVADSISESIEIPCLITVLYSIAMLAVLVIFIKKNGFMKKYGLCGFDGSYKEFLFFIPLIAICSVNFWNGVTVEPSLTDCLLTAAAKGIIGIVEELIFRGLLFVCMCRTNVKSAIIVSSLTFGIGHVVNLINGAPVLETVCQIIYACAIGFCFTMVFYVGKSLVPCILVHFIVNVSSAFGVAPADTQTFRIISTVFLTVVSLGFGLWLLMRNRGKMKGGI